MITDGQHPRLVGRAAPRLVAIAALIVSAMILGACGTGQRRGLPATPRPNQATTSRPAPTGKPGQPATAQTWIFTERALRQVTADPTVLHLLERGRIFEILQPGHPPLAGLAVVPTAKFASYQAMSSALANGSIDPWVKAILYDNESWAATPPDEQQAPGPFMAKAGALVHQHHLIFLASPALDLTTVLQPGVTSRDQAYLHLGLAQQAGRVADVVDVQAQSVQRDTTAYAHLVGQAAAQAHQANPSVVVVAGLSTNPTGAPVTSDQLLAAVHAAGSAVRGYWVNIPSPGPSCPGCASPRPDLAISLLTTVAGQPG
ncbi:MAG: hypothetical protein DLM54_08935 [Acidimicrobiales bacterium]|nr:MAG: hypothetical protein DLM54_08935 [Acidimicrobiales bacterium]